MEAKLKHQGQSREVAKHGHGNVQATKLRPCLMWVSNVSCHRSDVGRSAFDAWEEREWFSNEVSVWQLILKPRGQRV